MDKVIACIDATEYRFSVIDHAIWMARRLSRPLLFLHVHQQEQPLDPALNLGASIPASTGAELLDRMARLDQERERLAGEHASLLLTQAVKIAHDQGLTEVEQHQQAGNLHELLVDWQPQTRMLVMGRRPGVAEGLPGYLDHSVEKAVRSLSHPVMVAAPRFVEPRNYMIAFDASATSQRIIDAVIASPALRDLPAHLVTVAEPTEQIQQAMRNAQIHLEDNGRQVQTHLIPGNPDTALVAFARDQPMDLIIMGAYGRSRIKQWIVGSVATTVLRTTQTPVVVLR